MHFVKHISVILLSLFCISVQAKDIQVAAAANLRYVMPELIAAYQSDSGHKVMVSYAASGTLTTQILHGAPFELFLSANPEYIQRLVQQDKNLGEIVTFSYGQLALFAANHSTLDVSQGVNAIKQALNNNTLKKMAIANPIHAPYGQAAKKVLDENGLWQAVQSHLLKAENASQATQFTLSGSASVGFIPYAHAIQPNIKQRGRFIKLKPLLPQQAILLHSATSMAKQFLQFLQQDVAQTILAKHGFVVKVTE